MQRRREPMTWKDAVSRLFYRFTVAYVVIMAAVITISDWHF